MSNELHIFWGKLHRDLRGNVTGLHLLTHHCADVAACMETLLSKPNIRKRLAQSVGLADLTPTQVHRLCVLTAMHDFGKCSTGFQYKKELNPPFVAGHVAEVVRLFGSSASEKGLVAKALGLHEMLSWAADDGFLRLLIAAVCHHGKPISCQSGNANPALWRPHGNISPLDGLTELAQCVRQWYPLAFQDTPTDLLPDDPALQHAFSGLVMLADGLGSNEKFFPFSADNADQRIIFARKQAADNAKRFFLNPESALAALGPTLLSFSSQFSFPPRGVQTIIDTIDLPASGSTVIVEAENGDSGTETVPPRERG